MKCLIAAFLAIGFTASHAFGADTNVSSKVDAVDLHPDSAEITRVAHCSLPAGETSIVLSGLSPRLVSQSLRVSGLETGGVSIRSVSTRQDRATVPSPPTGAEQALIDEQVDLRGRLAALETKERMIRKVADAQPNVAIGASGVSASPDFWSSMWTKVADGLEDTSHRSRETQKRLDIVTKQLVQMRVTNETKTLSEQTLSVVIEVSADHAADADLKLVYQINAADWKPLYDARLRTDHQPAQLDLMRRASVTQSTGEDWTDVVLTLSTSSLSAATMAATLAETHDVTGNSRIGVASPPLRAVTGKVVSEFTPGVPSGVSWTSQAYDATQHIPGRVSIASGAKARLFKIGSRSTDVDLSVRSVPIADTHAYLQAKFESNDRIPLIPGDIELYRDGTFVGRAALKGAAPGDKVTIGFGMDDLVSVERSDVARKERNTTVEAGIASVQRAFKTIVTNRHPFPIRIEIVDREPAFDNVAIVLKEMPTMTAPTERQVDGHRGVLAWSNTYVPGETRSIVLAWQVRWPAKLGPPQVESGEAYNQTQVFRFGGGATF